MSDSSYFFEKSKHISNKTSIEIKMSPSSQTLQSYYNEFLRCAICSHDFEYDNYLYRPITLPICGHTMCGQCIDIIRNQTKCPQDQVSFSINNIPIDQLPTNYPLLFIVYDTIKLPDDSEQRYGQCLAYMKLDDETKSYFNRTQIILIEIALLIKPIINDKDYQSVLSRPMIRKIFSLLNSQYIDREGRLKALKAARSLGERTCIDFILHHQNPQQLTANLWSAVRSRGCQFLGPAMQEEVLKLILLALEDGSALSRKVLVLFVVQKLAPQYPRASKTSVGHVVQLLYRASCFKVQKREEESSLMQLKSEFRNYENLRREHDSQIIQIAMEAGLRISPEQWSSLLYGDTQHKSSMQSIIDKLSTPASFSQAIQEFLIVLQRAGDSSKHLSHLKTDFEYLSQIDIGNNDQQIIINDNQQDNSTWSLIIQVLQSIKTVLQSLIEFNIQESKTNYLNKTHHYHHRSYDLSSTTFTSSTSCSSPMTVSPLGGSSTTSEYHLQPLHPPTSQNNQIKYKVSMCRDFVQKQSCPRGVHCTFAHSKIEMDKYRAKSRYSNGPILPLSSSSNNNIPALPPPNSQPPTGPLPIFTSTNGANLIRPIPPTLLPLWNPQQQQQQQHVIQEIPQQHHHHHYYHPSQIPPSILQIHGHPTTTSYDNQQQPNHNNNNNNSSQIPVIAAAAQAILEQNNAAAAAAAFAANTFYRFQQQNPSMPYHQSQSMIAQQQQQQQQQQQSLLSRPYIQTTNTNIAQQSSNPMQQRTNNYTDSRFSSLSDQHNNHQSTTTHFPNIEDLRLPSVIPLNGNNSTDNSNINQRNYSVLQTIAAKNDDNLLYFPTINNNTNNLNRQQQTFLSGTNNNGLFNDILLNNNNHNNNTTNPISTLSTNTLINNRQQSYKSLSTMIFPQQQQQQQPQQQIRNDENVFHNNHQYASTFDDDDYALTNVSNNVGNSGVGGGSTSNDSSFFYFGSANAHATAPYNFYHPNSPLGGNGHSLKA
ncbi:unnamed protein product [Rotaria sordida]|uniref:RING-type E3 ubiquitin transferase n=2 Tax=Rotaria sordida TaxID=392033 RepID=A0A815JAH3_9BILA|nr:unnamed protein product [Rotaria sordida]